MVTAHHATRPFQPSPVARTEALCACPSTPSSTAPWGRRGCTLQTPCTLPNVLCGCTERNFVESALRSLALKRHVKRGVRRSQGSTVQAQLGAAEISLPAPATPSKINTLLNGSPATRARHAREGKEASHSLLNSVEWLACDACAPGARGEGRESAPNFAAARVEFRAGARCPRFGFGARGGALPFLETDLMTSCPSTPPITAQVGANSALETSARCLARGWAGRRARITTNGTRRQPHDTRASNAPRPPRPLRRVCRSSPPRRPPSAHLRSLGAK